MKPEDFAITPEQPEETTETTDEVTAEPVNMTDDMADELSIVRRERDEFKDAYIRLIAEFDNYRKRSQKERIELSAYVQEDFVKSLLPVIDDIERSLIATKKSDQIDAIQQGLTLLHENLFRSLGKKGLTPIETIGKDFDASEQEAIANIPAPAPEMKGKVLDEAERGYKLNDKVIRFAKVIIGD